MVKKVETGGKWWDKLGSRNTAVKWLFEPAGTLMNFDPYFSEDAYEHIWGVDGKTGLGRLDIGPGSMGL